MPSPNFDVTFEDTGVALRSSLICLSFAITTYSCYRWIRFNENTLHRSLRILDLITNVCLLLIELHLAGNYCTWRIMSRAFLVFAELAEEITRSFTAYRQAPEDACMQALEDAVLNEILLQLRVRLNEQKGKLHTQQQGQMTS
jgi:hypothetical protein